MLMYPIYASFFFVFLVCGNVWRSETIVYRTGKSLSEALIFASTNPQYDDWLFYDLRVQYMKIPSSEDVKNMLCTQIVFFVFTFRTIYVQNMFLTCSEHGIFMYWTCKSMKQFLSYFGLVDAKINASEKDLPVWKCNAMWREVMPIGCLFMLPNSKICCFFWLELLSSPSLWLAKTMERGKKRMLWSSTLPLMEFEAIQNMTLL